MNGKKTIDILIFISSSMAGVVSYLYLSGNVRWISGMAGGGIALGFLFLALKEKTVAAVNEPQKKEALSAGGVTELALLNEEDAVIAVWDVYGKTSLVIGRDVGENQVNVNLSQAAFAGMIDTEHATLNYSAGNWYVEDLGSKNGVSVRKADGKKYRLVSDKPCMLEAGDVIYIAMTKLLLR